MKGVIAALAAFVIAVVSGGAARADELQAPPTLTPAVAGNAAAACPDAAPYARALVDGITLAQATAATPILMRCATATRLFELQWKNSAAALALAAVELSRGLLEHDPALLKRAADGTHAWRSRVPQSDEQILTWDLVPDIYDNRLHAVTYVDGSCGANPYMNAAYIYVAARSGIAWLRTPRAIRNATPCNAVAARAASFGGGGIDIGASPFTVPIPTRPAPAPDEVLRPNAPPR